MRHAILELLVQWPPAPQHAVEDVGGDAARGQSGRVGGWGGAGHTRHLT
jgi:hypothetical protein